MMDNQPLRKMLFWELALQAGIDCKEKRKCSTLGVEGAKCNKSRQSDEYFQHSRNSSLCCQWGSSVSLRGSQHPESNNSV